LPKMRITCAIALASATRTQLRKGNNVDDSATGNVWVPIQLPGESLSFFNPTTSEWNARLPSGAVETKQALVVTANGHTTRNDTAGNHEYGSLVPEEQRTSCVPHCTWECTKPVCEQNCEPRCHRPKCETRCPKATPAQYEKCKVECGEPECQMFCPKDPCQGKKTLDCNTPACKTVCEKPKCKFTCSDDLDCTSVCPQPQCEWKCEKPTECPKPECRMICEKPPNCDTAPTAKPLKEGESVVRTEHAKKGEAKHTVGEWGQCSSQCGTGKQTRSVKCTAGDGTCSDLGMERPASERSCEDYNGCKDGGYDVGPWGTCSAQCGEGTQSRNVTCSNKKKCIGDKPDAERTCTHDAAECHSCKATIYGGPSFDGWSLELKPGDYTSSTLEHMGAKCDDVSSLKVYGYYCHLKGYEFGDFNQEHKGWSATFDRGDFKQAAMLKQGAKDNDMSSCKVWDTKDQDKTRSGSLASSGFFAAALAALVFSNK